MYNELSTCACGTRTQNQLAVPAFLRLFYSSDFHEDLSNPIIHTQADYLFTLQQISLLSFRFDIYHVGFPMNCEYSQSRWLLTSHSLYTCHQAYLKTRNRPLFSFLLSATHSDITDMLPIWVNPRSRGKLQERDSNPHYKGYGPCGFQLTYPALTSTHY